MAVHLSVNAMALDLAVQVGRVDRVGHIAVAVAGVALSESRDGVGRMGSRSGVGIGGVGGSNTGIVVVVVAVPVSRVVGSIAQVAGSVVGSMGRSVVGSMMGESSVGVGGGGD